MTKTLEFRTELKQLLDIIVHSLYSDQEIFLRELISNACDAIDKLRFESLTNPALIDDDADWQIRLSVDKDTNTLTISDNGLGMSEETIVENLGTIARSGTREFLERLRATKADDRPDLIGQFGVGFYSAFMVADRVTVVSRMAGEDQAVRWESDGEGTFRLDPAERASRGTDITLHLKSDALEFLEEHRLRHVVKKYSDFVEHPIVMEVEKTIPAEEEGGEPTVERGDEVLNSRQALWLRPASEVEEADYHAFYKQVSRDFQDPARTIHFSAEGTVEFRALLFLPAQRPFDFYWGEPKVSLQLYVQRVFIMDDCQDLLPGYLRFVKGVVDSADLPLNVSREMLQENAVLRRIRKGLVSKILRTLGEMKKDEPEAYAEFFKEFGPVLKEGLTQDHENRDTLADLLLFESTATEPGQAVSLQDYVDAMPPDQEAIYYLIGENRAQIEHSPLLEGVRAKDQHVLLLTDAVDEFVVGALPEYQEKKLQAVDRGAMDADDVPEEVRARFSPLFEAMGAVLDEIREVRASTRLKDSAACLVADENAMSAHMERLMKRMGRENELPDTSRILELNPEHAAVQALHTLYEADATDPRVEDYARLLYDQAVIAEGSTVKDPNAMARRINQLIARSAEASGS